MLDTHPLHLPLPDHVETTAARQFRVGHNRAITAWHRERVGATSDLRRSERAILSLIAGLEQWTGSNAEYCDPYSAEYVIHPVVTAIGNALSLDIGRLDGGALSSHVCELARRANCDPDTGQWIGDDDV